MKHDRNLLYGEFENDKSTKKSSKSIDSTLDFLNIGRIKNADESGMTENLAKKWICDKCTEEFYFTLPAKLEHLEVCKSELGSSKNDPGFEETVTFSEETSTNTMKKHYFCESCDRQLFLTPTEILKHKKSHQK